MDKKRFILKAAAAAVIAAFSVTPAIAEDVTISGTVSESIPETGGTPPDSVTITGAHVTAGDTESASPAVVIPASGSSLSIFGNTSVTISNSGIAPEDDDLLASSTFEGGTVIASSLTAVPAAQYWPTDYTGAVNGGAVDIETGEGGTISILRTDTSARNESAYIYQYAAVMVNAKDADTDLTLDINKTRAASRVTLQGGLYLAGPRTAATLNLTGAGSSLAGGTDIRDGASLVLNLEGDGSSISTDAETVSGGAPQLDISGAGSTLTLTTGAGTAVWDEVRLKDGASGTITANGALNNGVEVSGSASGPRTTATVTINGTAQGRSDASGNATLDVTLAGDWDAGTPIGFSASGTGSKATLTIESEQAGDPSKPASFRGLVSASGSGEVTVTNNGVMTGDLLSYDSDGQLPSISLTLNGTWTGNAIAGEDGRVMGISDETAVLYPGTADVTINKTGVWTTEGQFTVTDGDYSSILWYAPRTQVTGAGRSP